MVPLCVDDVEIERVEARPLRRGQIKPAQQRIHAREIGERLIERAPALKGRFDLMMSSLGSALPSFRRKSGEDDELLLLENQVEAPPAEAINPWHQHPPTTATKASTPKSASART